jgi:hypothetical protein
MKKNKEKKVRSGQVRRCVLLSGAAPPETRVCIASWTIPPPEFFGEKGQLRNGKRYENDKWPFILKS